ncbi:MAG: response regulator, partial [candidate division Zixibacteria bacterium]|nr:response regulator [candidate division Zixibacteria bacterium]
VSQGFRGEASLGGIQSLVELKEFREVKERKGCILVVDDDEVTRRAFGDTLEYHGYRALITENGEQALQALQDNADEISLVILDLFMPDMSGREVYQQISRLRPDMKVLISSGYPLDSDIQQLLTGDRVDFIGKPFKVEEFLSKIRSISDETGGIGQPREKKP